MATSEAAKQGVKTLAAQIRGVFAGLEDFATWADDLKAREVALVTAEAAATGLEKEFQRLSAEISDLIVRRAEEVAESAQAAEQAVVKVRAAAEAELYDLITRLDAARERAQTVERESEARINEAIAEVRIAEAELAETNMKLEGARRDLAALKAKFG